MHPYLCNPQALAQMQRELENRQDNSGERLRIKVAEGANNIPKKSPIVYVLRKKRHYESR